MELFIIGNPSERRKLLGIEYQAQLGPVNVNEEH
jgi:hypothetical protein